MHQPYENRLKHPPDFRVKYKLFDPDNGGRIEAPFQGIRWDFAYEHPNHTIPGAFIIWPEFEDYQGNLILESDLRVAREGTARMWIINPALRTYHKERIIIGMKGFLLEGKRIAECEVIEILGLMTNPALPLKSNST